MRKSLVFILIVFLIFFLTIFAQEQEEDREAIFAQKRQSMVVNQLQNRDIIDSKVLQAMLTVPRHQFVDERIKESAYNDYPLAIGEGQTISQPYIVALMTQLLELKGGERVLEIGTGSGYQAAVLAEIVEEVYTVEIYESLSKKSEKLIKDLGYRNIHFKIGDGYYGWEEYAPYDAIIVTCAPDYIPPQLLQQIRDDGGRIVIPVGGIWMAQTLMKIEKIRGEVKSTGIIGVRFVPMIGHSR
ncbi:MAG: protein-L-isoaspartate(D-aspartate) O-methyltransferase [Candidatus Atribacteria bacterium]|nr:protein-L-isoaspartate(D-aspartate) O-methyltransferase [Candidatus Atribacteria bacterium]MBE3127045.1 protein-L-isoaspartate(D-aspartate) O-methyltransferase [Candidatus Atribacteria bacterium]